VSRRVLLVRARPLLAVRGMTYAARTKVSVPATRLEIEAVLKRYGATRFAYMGEEGRAVVMFEANDRRLRFNLPVPEREQAQRVRWRALLLAIKAKLESVESGIESFEEAFLSHVVMADGQTIYERVREPVALEYKRGEHQPLLPDYSK
jgi:hypothetical protein